MERSNNVNKHCAKGSAAKRGSLLFEIVEIKNGLFNCFINQRRSVCTIDRRAL